GALAPGATGNGAGKVYLRDTTTDTTTLVSDVAGAGLPTNPQISPDGRYVAFHGDGQEPGTPAHATMGLDFQVYLWDRTTGTTKMVSTNVAGTLGSNTPIMVTQLLFSGDSKTLVYNAEATNLVAGQIDTNNVR